MNKRNAKKCALVAEASIILNGNPIAGVEDLLTYEDQQRFTEAREELAYEMLRRAGVEERMSAEEIVEKFCNTN